jgi:hypothetical protein
MHFFLSRLGYSPIASRAAVLLVLQAWSSLGFCDDFSHSALPVVDCVVKLRMNVLLEYTQTV